MYQRQTAPLLDYYRQRSRWPTVSGEGPARGHSRLDRQGRRREPCGDRARSRRARSRSCGSAGLNPGRVVDRLRGFVRPGMSTPEIDEDVEAYHPSRAGAAPAFKGYRGSRRPRASRSTRGRARIPRPSSVSEGDIVGLDLGCIVDGYYADCAITLPRRCRRASRSCSTSPAKAW